MRIKSKSLTRKNIDESPEIQSWLNQFDAADQPVATSLLRCLRFISKDEYSRWLLAKLGHFTNGPMHAIYAVRKFRSDVKALWLPRGRARPRPATAQGSEDLVVGEIANALRMYNGCFRDNPSRNELYNSRIRDIILIDDSIGSGKRVSDFVRLMINDAHFRSWWSYGRITLHVISLVRSLQGQRRICSNAVGSLRKHRKYKVQEKIKFYGNFEYDFFKLDTRWYNNHRDILDLCDNNKKIAKDRRRGFDAAMGNFVFYHSVPNNIPGMLYSRKKNWQPLFPERALPNWCRNLLDGVQNAHRISTPTARYKCEISDKDLPLLLHVRRGVRTRTGLARCMDLGLSVANMELDKYISAGLVSDSIRLTKAGHDAVKKKEKEQIPARTSDRSLYVPTSWCTGQATIQPSAPIKGQVDSVELVSTEGDGRLSSLEKTDAMAALPLHERHYSKNPSEPQSCNDAHGPVGPKG